MIEKRYKKNREKDIKKIREKKLSYRETGMIKRTERDIEKIRENLERNIYNGKKREKHREERLKSQIENDDRI